MREYSIGIAGDTSLGEWYLRKKGRESEYTRLQSDPLSFFNTIKPIVSKTDFLVLNLETVLASNPVTSIDTKKYTNWDSTEKTIDILKKLEVSAVSLCNNHSMDFGYELMLSTKESLISAGIDVFGAGKNLEEAMKPYIVELQGDRSSLEVYFFTAMKANRRYHDEFLFFAKERDSGVNPFSRKGFGEKIANIKASDSNSYIILFPHWQGYDYKLASDDIKVRELCRHFIEMGVDIVIGHGPHMINGADYHNGKPIIYSIGNFIFNSPGRYKKLNAPPYSFIIRLMFKETANGWEVINNCYPILTDNKATGYNSRPLQKEEAHKLKEILMSTSSNYCRIELELDNFGYYFKIDPRSM